MPKNEKNNQRKYDMDLLHMQGFDDVASALAALDSVSDELRESDETLREVKKNYDNVCVQNIKLSQKLAETHRVIVAQSIEILNLRELCAAKTCGIGGTNAQASD